MNEQSLFVTALEKETPVERNAFLDEACAGNPVLRQRINQLLLRHEQAKGFLDSPAMPREKTVAYEPILEGPGTIIGPYKLLQQIGEGGFGTVFMAEQEQPVRRMVALKIIKPGMDTAQVIARFESERQALALMDHPNIAKVLDAGATASGRPYFVMELVKGVPVTEFCDKNHLAPEARLRLFIDVCHAIQHAHHKGVIHRDIKPSNVMVTLHDGNPVVKVIDFGVAKATVQKLTEKTLFTNYGQMIGTPAYMSPEQAEMSGLDIDTRSDVYSLGVLLYELLTGTTPLEGKQLREAGYAEMQRLIREEEAPRPSNRLSSLGDSATISAGNRGMDVKHLARLLSGDLDWVVMKALDKDRNRRYGTPDNFAQDIERYLRREAILARPPSTVYKFRKFIQRNRIAALTSAAIAAALLAGIGIATWQAVRAEHAQRIAQVAAENERKAREQAEVKEAESNSVLHFVESKIFAAALPEGLFGGLGREVTLRKALEAAMPYVEKSFVNQPLIEARLRIALATLHNNLGQYQAAIEQYGAARLLFERHRATDHPYFLHTMRGQGVGLFGLGRYNEALKINEETLPLCKAKFGIDGQETLRCMNTIAGCYHALGRFDDALKLHQETFELRRAKLGLNHLETLESLHNLGVVNLSLKRYAEAGRFLEQTLALKKSIKGINHPETIETMTVMGINYGNQGKHDEACQLLTDSLARRREVLGPNHPTTLRHMSNLAMIYEKLDRFADALALHKECLNANLQTPGKDLPSKFDTMKRISFCYRQLGQWENARQVSQDFIRQCEEIVQSNPNDLHNKSRLGGEYSNLGLCWEFLGQHTKSIDEYNRAVTTLEAVLSKQPDRVDAKRYLTITRDNKARVEAKLKK